MENQNRPATPTGNRAGVVARNFLAEELAKRCGRNSRYSMRAFARDLGLTPAALSLILAGRRAIGRKTAQRLAKQLGLGPIETAEFVESAGDRGREISGQENDYSQMTLDMFSVISEWYHFAILSLTQTNGFVPKSSWIASRLGISEAEARAAIDKMVRLGLLDTTTHPWKQIGNGIMVENSVSTSATRNFQKQVLELALTSLLHDPIEKRVVTSMTMAIRPDLLPLANRKIKKFRYDLMELLEKEGGAQEVYHLGVQLYPVSRRNG